MREHKHLLREVIPGSEKPDKRIQGGALTNPVIPHRGAGRVGLAASVAYTTETAEGWEKYQGATTGGKKKRMN